MNIKIYYGKLSWSALCLVMMLQRTPVMRILVQSQFSLFPRVQHMWKAAVAAVTVGAYNSVTAASGQIEIAPGSSSTTVGVGEELRVVLSVAGEKATEQHPPELWEITGALPAGTARFHSRRHDKIWRR